MIDLLSLEAQWRTWEEELRRFMDIKPERQKILEKIFSQWIDLLSAYQSLSKTDGTPQSSSPHHGLGPLKSAALSVLRSIENSEFDYFSEHLRETHRLIAINIAGRRLLPKRFRGFQQRIDDECLSAMAAAKIELDQIERDLSADITHEQEEIETLRHDYERFLFSESTYEAAASFHSVATLEATDRVALDAFAALLGQVALSVRGDEKARLKRDVERFADQRVALFEKCSLLTAEPKNPEEAKSFSVQILNIINLIQKLETEIEASLVALSIPSLDRKTSLVVKKIAGQATTLQLNKISQSTGDKT